MRAFLLVSEPESWDVLSFRFSAADYQSDIRFFSIHARHF
nr:MAG TPA: hypothetical protein [Caudoviricetes sp.]